MRVGGEFCSLECGVCIYRCTLVILPPPPHTHICDLGWNTEGQREVNKYKFLEAKASVLVPTCSQHLMPCVRLNKASVNFSWVSFYEFSLYEAGKHRTRSPFAVALPLDFLPFSQSRCCPLLGLVGISWENIYIFFVSSVPHIFKLSTPSLATPRPGWGVRADSGSLCLDRIPAWRWYTSGGFADLA